MKPNVEIRYRKARAWRGVTVELACGRTIGDDEIVSGRKYHLDYMAGLLEEVEVEVEVERRSVVDSAAELLSDVLPTMEVAAEVIRELHLSAGEEVEQPIRTLQEVVDTMIDVSKVAAGVVRRRGRRKKNADPEA